MIRSFLTPALILLLVVAASPAIRADVRSDEKTKIEFTGMLGRMVNLFGGKGAREGIVSTVAVKGDRKATFNDSTGQIIDLAEEKVYELDMKKKSYKVATFAELRRRMEEARAKAEQNAQKEQAKEKTAEPAPKEKESNLEIDFDVKNTGQKKTVNGFDAHQILQAGQGTVIRRNRLHGAIIESAECVYEIHSIGDYRACLS